MASCVAFNCFCRDDTWPSNVARAAINGATSGSVGCGRFVRRLKFTSVLVRETPGTTGTGSTDSSTLVTLSGTTSFEVDGVTGSGKTSELLVESPPFMERVLK